MPDFGGHVRGVAYEVLLAGARAAPRRRAARLRTGRRAEENVGGATRGTLEDAARSEREYLRGRVAREVGREPSEEEMDEWLREHRKAILIK